MSLGNWQRDLLRIALYVVGMVLAATAVPHILWYTTGVVVGPFDDTVTAYGLHTRWMTLASVVVQFVVGLWVVRKSAFLAARAYPTPAQLEEGSGASPLVVGDDRA